MSLFVTTSRVLSATMDAVMGDPMILTPRARPDDVNAAWIEDPARPVVTGLTGIYTHLAVDTNEPDARDRYADRKPGTSQARHLIDINNPVDGTGAAIDIKPGDVVTMLDGEGAGRWYVSQTSPNDVGGILLTVNKL